MKHFLSFSLSLLTIFFLLLASERRAFAYVDPGSGLFALQSFASVMAAVGYLLRKRISAIFCWKQSASVPTEQPHSRNDPPNAG